MAPPKQSTEQQQLPTADDLLFLLSIVSNPNGFIAERQSSSSSDVQNKKSCVDGERNVGTTTSAPLWQQTLTSLPMQRRQMILDLQRLANARQKWNDLSSSKSSAKEKALVDYRMQTIEADALGDVENAASTIRICTTEYLESIKGYINALRQWWHMHNHYNNYSELAAVGGKLASQLICQLQWDERLALATLTFLDEELYYQHTTSNGKHNSQPTNNTTDKLRVWADAMSKMIKINKSYWEFVEREVYDETVEMEQEMEEVPEFLNGEHSTQIIPIGSSLMEEEQGENHQETTSENTGGIKTNYCQHERIVSSASVEKAIETFLHGKLFQTKEKHTFEHLQGRNSFITSILLVGEEGCGKTHLLDSIQQRAAADRKLNKSSIKVLRPKYPVDLVGNSIGSSEDRLIALFTYASRIVSTAVSEQFDGCSRYLIMLDDIDRMFSLSNDSSEASYGDFDGSSTQFCIGRRCRALFITILDAFREHWPSMGDRHLLVLCTARSRCSEVADRFDRTFKRGPPDETQRRDLITSCLLIDDDVNHTALEGEDDDINVLLSLVAHHSAGRSAFELAQCCREAILSCSQEINSNMNMRRVQYLDTILQTKSPQSLRGGSLDGVVDIRVFTPEELQSKLTANANGDIHLPLLGAEAKRAHEALMNVVITPLCRSDDIRALLYGGSGNGQADVDEKPIRVGALLAGAPGVGKTVLAYHCASLAAKMSRVSLLDVSATSLIHKEIGGSERAVQRLFAAVHAAAPCILLLDGIECIAPRRGNDNTSEGTLDRVLSTFLTEMDGVDGASGNVAVIGVTNNPDLIDPSLLRPGRLEKTITLGAPDFEARKEIIARQINEIDIDFTSAGYFDAKNKDDVSRFVAMETAGMSAVEAIAICREASMECLRELNFEVSEKPTLTYEHFKSALKIMKGKHNGLFK
ncbi:hypothetical protein ACHAXR_008887 [Thalassiosira sp. AJA248-18]